MDLQAFSNKNVHFVSLGCPKNLVDSEVMLGVLAKANYKIVTEPDPAGVIVINTCGFIEAAQKESIDTILELTEYKSTGSCHTLVVTGCMVQRYSQQLQEGLPEVDLFIGTGEYHKIAEYLTAQRISPQGPLNFTEPTYIHDHQTPRLLSEKSSSAFLKLAEGCKKRCSFCIIPMMRGNLRSRPMDSLVHEARGLVRQGIKEINLVAQDLTDYGIDLKDRHLLTKLLKELVLIEGIEWIRLFYAYPDGITPELIELIANEKKICPYLDMPLQHCNNSVLKRMNRAITKEKMTALITDLRKKIPDLSIRTSFIVGFPGETEAQFQELCDFVLWAQLEHVGVFKFSREEGTPSYDLDQQIDEKIKDARYELLTGILNSISLEKARLQVGQIQEVLIDGVHPESDDLLVARNQKQAKGIDTVVIINDGFDLRLHRPGILTRVEITDTAGPDLVGRIILKLMNPC